jgi:sec-independent protein translocase protein TatC
MAVITMLNVLRHPLAPIKDVWSVPADEPEVFAEMTLQEHLEELRSRLVRSCIAVGAAFIVGLILTPHFLRLIERQADITTGFDIISPTEPFTDYMKVALYIGIAISLPVLVYEVIAFLAPGLTRRERRALFTALPFISALFLGGAAFAFFVAAPRAFDFLSGFNHSLFQWSPRGQEVISFYLTLMIGMGLAFELPILMYLLSRLHIVNAKRMSKFRRYAVVLILVAAAIITPTPDPFNMMVVAAPMLLLYELGILLARTV